MVTTREHFIVIIQRNTIKMSKHIDTERHQNTHTHTQDSKIRKKEQCTYIATSNQLTKWK